MGVEESYVAGLGKSMCVEIMCVEIGYWVSLGKKIHRASCFRVARNPSRVDSKRGDRFLQTGLIDTFAEDLHMGSNNKCLGKSALVNRNAFGLTRIISPQEE